MQDAAQISHRLFIGAAVAATKMCQLVGVFFLISSGEKKTIPSPHFQTSQGPCEI